MSAKTITNEAMLECLRMAVRKTLDRKRRLGQYAVVWEEGQIKELRFYEKDSRGNTGIGAADSSGMDEDNQ
ncbi:MAG: hypothetical protein P8L18_06825 [Verrucomicrobiota bacterium]|jgi:hypothetical protein|nr:hypothetical protein [Verrucomicrobiota bacterium]